MANRPITDDDSGPEATIQSRLPAEDPSLDRTTDRRIVPDDNEPPSRPLPPRSQFGAISTPTQFTPKESLPDSESKTRTQPPPPAAPPPPPATRSNPPSHSAQSRSSAPAPQQHVGPQPARVSQSMRAPLPASAPPPAPPAPPPSMRVPIAEQARTMTPSGGYESRPRMPAHPAQSMNTGMGGSMGSSPLVSQSQPPMPPPSVRPESPNAHGSGHSSGHVSGQSPVATMHGGFAPSSSMMGAPPPVAVAPQPLSTPQQQREQQQHGHTMSGFVPGAPPSGPGSPGIQNQAQGMGQWQSPPSQGQPMQGPPGQGLALRADAPRELRSAAFHVVRSRAYSFVLDQRGIPVEIGSGRFAKAFLGEERWLESKTDFRREIVIKILQKGVSEEDRMRFQMEQDLLERVQGHPNIVELFASGEGEDIQFLPPSIRDKVDPEFMILERLEMSLEERLKGSRHKAQKDDLLQCDMRERIFRVLDYMIPIASAIEYAHIVRNICHRDLKPANVLIKLPDPNLRGSTLEVRLADFNVAKLADADLQMGMTQMKGSVPGTLFFQSPEQETNIIELLVNVQNGVPEVEFFEDFYIQIAKNDSFSLWNRGESYPVLYADRTRKRVVLGRPYRDVTETNVRARIQKSVGRPADIYSLGAVLYYLISGAYSNPKTLYDAFHKFIEYEKADEANTIESYLMHEYNVINSLRAPKTEGQGVAPADRFFTYKHYLDGNGELIDPNVMLIIAKCMIRNKPDSYCQTHDLETRGISDLVQDLINLYALYGVHPAARPTHLARRAPVRRRAFGAGLSLVGGRIRQFFRSIFFRTRR